MNSRETNRSITVTVFLLGVALIVVGIGVKYGCANAVLVLGAIFIVLAIAGAHNDKSDGAAKE